MPNASVNGTCFVDTGILLYLRDPLIPAKQGTARRWISSLALRDRLVVSPQVLTEYAENILQRFKSVPFDVLMADLAAMQVWCRAATGPTIAAEAALIHREWGFAFSNSALIAAAHAFGCALFLSEDLHHGQQVGGIEIVNPFLAAPDRFEI
jgi:predicted nucleic acid-binding protein